MIESELIEYVRVGIDRNIIVFDNAAKAGKFSTRLIALMKEVALANGILLDSIIIPINYKLDDFYKACKCTLPTDKERIIVGIGPLHGSKDADEYQDDRHVLLGAY